MGTFTRVASTKDLPPGKSIAVQVGGRSVALFNVAGAIHAVDDDCTHAGGPLSEGELEGCVVTCPFHGATFDLRTGKALSRPASVDVRCYGVRVQGDEIQLEI